MQRRKFIAAMGSLTAAGAAGLGTGAFTSVEADRQVDVTVTGDSSAYLALKNSGDANDQHFDASSTGEASVDFADTNAGGSGVNPNAKTVFNSVFKIVNQGTQAVYVELEGESGIFIATHSKIDSALKMSDPSSDPKIAAAFRTNEDQLSSGTDTNWDGAVKLDPGKSVDVDFAIASATSDLSGELTIKADVEAPDD